MTRFLISFSKEDRGWLKVDNRELAQLSSSHFEDLNRSWKCLQKIGYRITLIHADKDSDWDRISKLRPCQIEWSLDTCQSSLLYHQHAQLYTLSNRQICILNLLKEAKSNKQIARTLFISEATIKSHLYRIFKIIGVKNRSQAREWSYQYLHEYLCKA